MKAIVLIDYIDIPRGIGTPCVIVVDCPDYDQERHNYYQAVQVPAMEVALRKLKEWCIIASPLRVEVYPVDAELVATMEEKPSEL